MSPFRSQYQIHLQMAHPMSIKRGCGSRVMEILPLKLCHANGITQFHGGINITCGMEQIYLSKRTGIVKK
jgi:hypothetical protein